MDKRYSIVRVDDKCPLYLREFTDQEAQSMFCCSGKYMCENCRYGDTKEQLIKKVTQSLKGTLWNDRKGLTYEEIAKKIIEFLGVEE